MSYFKFSPNDILNLVLKTNPKSVVEQNGDQITGSVYLDNNYIISEFGPQISNLNTREYKGYSQKKGGFLNFFGPFTASVSFFSAISGSTNNILYHSLSGSLIPFYKVENNNYNTKYGNVGVTSFRVINIPSVYYDKKILTGSFTASDYDNAGDLRQIYDNGLGGVYSGSITGTLVGNIFYDDGVVILKKTDLLDFGLASSVNSKWKVSLKGTHNIPVKIFNCRAPSGELNASTNSTFYQQPTTGDFKNSKEIIMNPKATYITQIGIYDNQYRLVALVKLAQPIKKEISTNINFRIRWDW